MNYPPESFFLSILRTFEAVEIPYFVVGGFAAVIYGISRVTYDVDIVVRLEEAHIPLLTHHYPLPRYYADPEQIRSSIAMGVSFNIIDTQLGEKADLIPAVQRHVLPFQRRVRQHFYYPGITPLEIWCASREDTILGKLYAWSEVTSRKHERDILEMVVYVLKNKGSQPALDLDYLDTEAKQLGENAYHLWQVILTQAQSA